jgi:hypothetical protein
MQFAVIAHAIDSANVPPHVAIGLVKETFRKVSANQEPRIKAAYPFAGERAGIFIIEAKSGEELQEVVNNLPFAGIVKLEIHAVTTIQSALKTVEEAEGRILAMMAAAPAGR